MRHQTITPPVAPVLKPALSGVLLISIICLALPSTLRASTAAEQDNKRNERIFRDAKTAIRKGKYEEATDLYNRALAENSKDTKAMLGRAFALSKLQRYVECFETATEALKIDQQSARAHALIGLALLRSGFVRNAIAELELSLSLDPKEALAWGAASEIDYYEGRAKESRQKAFYAHNLDPDEPDYIVTYARASSRVEDYREAADAYELFLAVAPLTDVERRDRIRGLVHFYRQLAGLQVHQLSGPSNTELAFHMGGDRRPYVRVKVNGREALFVVDTGSGFTVISRDAASRLGVGEIARGGTSQGVGGDGKFPIVYGLIKQLQFGDVKMRMIPCFIRPFHGSKDREPAERAEGFIGLSILSHFLTEIDYRGNLIKLDRDDSRELTVQGTPATTVVPFRTTQNGLISIETRFDGDNPINAILDSGASSSVISTAAVDRLKMHDQIIKGQTVNVIGAAGVTENVAMLFIRNCRVADLQQSNLRALVLNFTAINETSGFEQSGILGGDFLRNFRLTINFSRGLVALQPHSPAVTNQE